MNRIERFLERQTPESIERKMKEWGTTNVVTFFQHIHGELTIEEIEFLIFHFPNIVKSEKYDYSYT